MVRRRVTAEQASEIALDTLKRAVRQETVQLDLECLEK
jgi:hypothetical protein